MGSQVGPSVRSDDQSFPVTVLLDLAVGFRVTVRRGRVSLRKR
jgi:hypothetical protein